MENTLNYDQILASLKQKKDWIEEAIASIELLARGKKELRGRPRKSLETTGGEAKPAVKKRTMSASARKAIGEATKKRWALKRAAEAAAAKRTGPRKAKKSAAKKATKKVIASET